MKYIANPLIFGAPRDFAKVRKQSYPGLFPERHGTHMKHLRNSLDFHQDTCHHPISWDRVPGHFLQLIAHLGDREIPTNSYGIPWYSHTPRGRSRVFTPPLRFRSVFEKFPRISRISRGVAHSNEFRARAVLDPEPGFGFVTGIFVYRMV